MDKEIYHKTLEAEKDQTEFKSEIVRGNWKNKSEKQISAIENIKNLHKSREKVIKLFNDYSKIASKAKYKSIYGERLRILTPKQMLQRLEHLFIKWNQTNCLFSVSIKRNY